MMVSYLKNRGEQRREYYNERRREQHEERMRVMLGKPKEDEEEKDV